MLKRRNQIRKKGFFGEAGLPVASKYFQLQSRRLMLLIGVGGAAVLLLLFGFDVWSMQGRLVSNGPLSSNHVAFADNCQTCHTPFGSVTDQACMVCHEQFSDDLGTHTFAAHYVYQSRDLTRVAERAEEGTCISCHTEHEGRHAAITEVSDVQCNTCHEQGQFEEDHVEFEVIRDSLADEANLIFPHTYHVNQVVEQIRTVQNVAQVDVEQSCLYCHQPEADGKNFQPLSYEQSCSACHLRGISTPPLDIARRGQPGVVTLAEMRRQLGPASVWATHMSLNDFLEDGGQVIKDPVVHNDPWIMENLRRIRETLYPGQHLADLLKASASVEARDDRLLYEEALATLDEYTEGLRDSQSPEVQDQLDSLEILVGVIRDRLQNPYARLNATRFRLTPADLDTNLTSEQLIAYQDLVDQLTEPCQTCHLVGSNALSEAQRDAPTWVQAELLRVQGDQNELIRANFDHRAHVIQRGCLDCHSRIPIQEYLGGPGEGAPAELDHAGIVNLPAIASCQTCHAENKTASTCITCHDFHPDKPLTTGLLRVQ